MRIKRSRLKMYHHRRAIPKKDSEGNSYLEYGPESQFMAEMWPAGGKLQMELYGMRTPYIRNCRIDGKYEILYDESGREYYRVSGLDLREGDGICLDVPGDTRPDYKVIAIRPYRFLTLEVERIL